MLSVMSSRMRVLQLYKCMLREGEKLSNYNFRTYGIRRIKDAFREHKSETDAARVDQLILKAEENLALLKRQAVISQLYTQRKIVIEGDKS